MSSSWRIACSKRVFAADTTVPPRPRKFLEHGSIHSRLKPPLGHSLLLAGSWLPSNCEEGSLCLYLYLFNHGNDDFLPKALSSVFFTNPQVFDHQNISHIKLFIPYARSLSDRVVLEFWPQTTIAIKETKCQETCLLGRLVHFSVKTTAHLSSLNQLT